jgi:hypothetical protein
VSLFNPLITQTWKHLRTQPKRKLEHWLELEQKTLEDIAAAITLTSGIPPRAFQEAQFQYASTAQTKHNLFIMDNHPVIGWAKAKQGSHMHQATLWALPQALAKPLYIYLGVIWPDTLQVLNQVSRAVTCEH